MAEEELVEIRRKKAVELKKLGVHPFGASVPVTDTIRDLLLAVPVTEELSEEPGIGEEDRRFRIAGRVLAIRRFGKGAFLRLRDRSFEETQIFISRRIVSDKDWEVFGLTDVGDHILVEGRQFRTRRGDRALRADTYTLITKALRPLPEKWHGLSDREIRYRQRYLDLIANEESRRTFLIRSSVITHIRQFLNERDFIEVETPMMHQLVSGAAARPFLTHHNALNIDLCMRIAPELHLKRLVTGGFERVYEIGRNFRNEGLSPRHNPEFTMLEFYHAHATWQDLMNLTEEMISSLILEIRKEEAEPLKLVYQGKNIDFSRPWMRLDMREAILGGVEGICEEDLKDADRLRKKALELAGDDEVKKADLMRMGLGELTGFVFDEGVKLDFDRPVFITGYPVEISPLARRNDENPHLADRFELMIAGYEIANAFNELNDPDDQRSRFAAQMEAREAGAVETMDYDEDYVRALEHGLPPTAGEGVGIDRLVMLLTDSASIRDVILFPLMRP